ncbi:MAG: META domain-containing protein [Sulfurimonas sp.]|nr:META domain-containing protein [Sulfurimonas sp.]
MIKKTILPLTFIATLFFTACATNTAKNSTKADVSLTNTYFKVLSLNHNEVEVFEREPYIQFKADGSVKGHLGCNNFFGSYKIEDKNIAFENIASTKMMCPNIKTEDAFTNVLQSVKTYEIKGETMIFSNTNGEEISVLKAIYF